MPSILIGQTVSTLINIQQKVEISMDKTNKSKFCFLFPISLIILQIQKEETFFKWKPYLSNKPLDLIPCCALSLVHEAMRQYALKMRHCVSECGELLSLCSPLCFSASWFLFLFFFHFIDQMTNDTYSFISPTNWNWKSAIVGHDAGGCRE